MKITVTEAAIGERVDKFLSAETEYTRSYIAKLAEDGCLFVGGKAVKVNYKLREGDEIELNVPELQPYEVVEEEILLQVKENLRPSVENIFLGWGDSPIVNQPITMSFELETIFVYIWCDC